MSAYAPRHEAVAIMIREHDRAFSRECRRMMEATIVNLRTKRDPHSRRWKTSMPLFLSGGGSVMPFYRSFIGGLSAGMKRLYNPCQGIQRRSLSKPENFVAAVDEQTYHRLAVAWGLSYEKTNIGQVTRPGDIEDVPPRRHTNGAEEFVSKDMV